MKVFNFKGMLLSHAHVPSSLTLHVTVLNFSPGRSRLNSALRMVYLVHSIPNNRP